MVDRRRQARLKKRRRQGRLKKTTRTPPRRRRGDDKEDDDDDASIRSQSIMKKNLAEHATHLNWENSTLHSSSTQAPAPSPQKWRPAANMPSANLTAMRRIPPPLFLLPKRRAARHGQIALPRWTFSAASLSLYFLSLLV